MAKKWLRSDQSIVNQTVPVGRQISTRLMRAIEHGNQFEIKNAQEFYLRSSETLRRLDLAVETERRKTDAGVSKREVEETVFYISYWMQTAFAQFLRDDSETLMGITAFGEFKHCASQRFKGILHRTLQTSLGTGSRIPAWAEHSIREGWNVY